MPSAKITVNERRAVYAARPGACAARRGGRRGAGRRAGGAGRTHRRRGLEPADCRRRPDRARRDPGHAFSFFVGAELPPERRDLVRDPRALRHVRRRHVPRAHCAHRVRRERPEEAGAQEPGGAGGRRAGRGMRRDPQQILRRQTMTIEIDLARQQLRYGSRTYTVSTSKLGPGEKNGSFCTPRGSHIVRAKIGAGQPLGAVFVRRRPTGEVWTPEMHERYPGRDWILTRILWLSGCEPGRNRLGDVDTMRRYIYIHGCPDSAELGKPGSIGCVRMRNRDVAELFDRVEPYTPVEIKE